MLDAAFAIALAAVPACGKSGGPPAASEKDATARPVQHVKTPLEKAIDKALVLESALDKAKAALVEAEHASPRDEAEIAERAGAVRALEDSIKRSRQMIEALRARSP